MVYCIVPAALRHVHDDLRAHFAADPIVEAVVERRARDRRRAADRRVDGQPARADRRVIRSLSGRRIADRRTSRAIAAAFALPPAAEPHRAELVFLEREAPSDQRLEDIDTARLVMRWQTGDPTAFTDLYLRYFDRVYGYARLMLVDPYEAEDVAQEAFVAVYDTLAHYEHRGAPFRSWLFRSVRNRALDRLRRRERLTVVEDGALLRRIEDAEDDHAGGAAIGDRRLLALLEKLPESQRRLLVLRYILDLDMHEIGRVTGRTPEAVRQQHQRAMTFLRRHMAGELPLAA